MNEFEDLNHPDCYKFMDNDDQLKLDEWINNRFEPAKKFYQGRSSYGLKHVFEHESGIYVTNGEFKGAMLAAGHKPEDEKELNWYFKIRLKFNDSFYAFVFWLYWDIDSPLGDLARDMASDKYFPRLSNDREEILRYVENMASFDGPIRAFKILWKRYEKFKFNQQSLRNQVPLHRLTIVNHKYCERENTSIKAGL